MASSKACWGWHGANAPRPRTSTVAFVRRFVLEYKQGQTLETDSIEPIISDTAVMAQVDAKHLYQVLTVLVHNALKYGRIGQQPARVRLRVAQHERSAVIDVMDRGPGIPESVAAQLFRPFFTTSEHGTGLGLYIARELCRANRARPTTFPCPPAAPASVWCCPAPHLAAHLIADLCVKHLSLPAPRLSFTPMNETRSALVVDDERDIRELLVLTLGRMGLRISTAANLAEARELLASNPYDLCITDMRLPDGNGIELVSEIAQHYPRTPVAMITAFGSMDLAVEALKAGAFDFVSKPVDISVLRGLVKHALELNNSERPAPGPATEQAARLLGASPAMDVLRTTISKVARSRAPVYILGESGVGKELVARTIHARRARGRAVRAGQLRRHSRRADGKRILRSPQRQLQRRPCRQARPVPAAHGGTLFLDEVAELPLQMQVKLLRAIQKSRYVRWVRPTRNRWMCAFSRPPTRTWPSWSRTGASATICTTAST